MWSAISENSFLSKKIIAMKFHEIKATPDDLDKSIKLSVKLNI